MLKIIARSDTIPPALHGPALVDHQGLPRYWATVWLIICSGGWSESTTIKKLRYIESLYCHSDELIGNGSLDIALGSMNEQQLSRVLESWFVSISNRSSRSQADEARWQEGLSFVSTIVSWISKHDHSQIRLQKIETHLHRLSYLYRQLHLPKRRYVPVVRSLPANVVQHLYELLEPESPQNPFARQATRWRVYVSFILMLHQGLRRGELLLLPADAIKAGFDKKHNKMRFWLNVQNNPYEDNANDPRYSRPGIKTAQSIRQIPVSEPVANIVQSYVDNYRGKPSHSYLLNSQKNHPLSTEALTKIFSELSENIAPKILKELNDRTNKTSITPHDLRHTCAVVRLNQFLQHGDSMDEALQKMRAFFGWSRSSDMPLRYTKAVFEDRLSDVWGKIFDDRASLLQSISRASL